MFLRAVVAISVFILFILFSPFLLNIDPEEHSVDEELVSEFTGALSVNDALSRSKKIHLNEVNGPESFVVIDDHIYTGLLGGEIVRFSDGKLEPFIRTGTESCPGMWDERNCGRPLGLRRDKAGRKLYVADAFKGLLVVDVKTKEITTLLKTGQIIGGKPLTFPNDLVIDHTSGFVYLSDSSTKWRLDEIIVQMMERKPTGRIIRYNLATREAEVIVDGLKFANGVELSADGKDLLIAETLLYKVHRYNLRSKKVDVFASKLPGMPDNIRRSKFGGYWIGLVTGVNKTSPNILQQLGPYPLFCKFIARSGYAFASLFQFISDNVYTSEVTKDYADYFNRMQYLYKFIKPYGIVVKVDDDGNVVRSLHATNGDPAFISEVIEHDGKLYFGSYRNNYVAALNEKEI